MSLERDKEKRQVIIAIKKTIKSLNFLMILGLEKNYEIKFKNIFFSQSFGALLFNFNQRQFSNTFRLEAITTYSL